MAANVGMGQRVVLAAVVVGAGVWAILTQTDLLGRTDPPVVQAEPIVIAEGDAADPEPEVAAQPVENVPEAVVAETAPEAPEEEQVAMAPAPEEAPEEVAASPAPADEAAPEPEETLLPLPAFDIVRVEADGSAIIAGSAPAGWTVSILLDGGEIAAAQADGAGQFAAFVDLGRSDVARILTLSATDGAQVLLSEAQVLIAPVVTRIAEAEEPAPQEAPAEETPAETVTVAEDAVAELSDELFEQASAETEQALAEAATDAASGLTDDLFAEIAAEVESEAQEGAAAEEAVTEAVASLVTETAEAVAEAPVPAPEASEPETAEETVAEAVAPEADTTEAPVVSTVSPADPVVTEAQTETAPEPALPVADASAEPQSTEVAAVDADTATAPAPQPAPAAPVETATEAPQTPEPAEPAAPAVVLLGSNGVEVLQPATGPEVLVDLAIDAITYSDTGEVQISGRSAAGFVRVYLNNRALLTLEVPEPGVWTANLADVAPGVYTLRVDSLDADGAVVSRVETPFQREEPEKVQALAEELVQTRRPLTSVEVVQPGSTLWAISRKTYGAGVLYVNIFEANRDQIRDPDLIYPGQIFDLPAPPGAKKKSRASGQ